jgi:hypothetical protein
MRTGDRGVPAGWLRPVAVGWLTSAEGGLY